MAGELGLAELTSSSLPPGREMAVFAAVSSLQNHCLRAVACQLPDHETSLDRLPVEIKTKLVNLLSKRGLLTDYNLAKVSA